MSPVLRGFLVLETNKHQINAPVRVIAIVGGSPAPSEHLGGELTRGGDSSN